MRSIVLALGVLLIAAALAGTTSGQARTTWYAPLTSAEEVPRNTSQATGQAAFELVQGGNALRYWLFINNLQDPTMAHIHIGAAGQNGPVSVWLYPPAPPPRPIAGSVTSMIGDGTITAANMTGPLQGQPFSALITALNNGTAYVNVHTNQFPGGEIRGQIR
jgi:hypothetical protein